MTAMPSLVRRRQFSKPFARLVVPSPLPQGVDEPRTIFPVVGLGIGGAQGVTVFSRRRREGASIAASMALLSKYSAGGSEEQRCRMVTS